RGIGRRWRPGGDRRPGRGFPVLVPARGALTSPVSVPERIGSTGFPQATGHGTRQTLRQVVIRTFVGPRTAARHPAVRSTPLAPPGSPARAWPPAPGGPRPAPAATAPAPRRRAALRHPSPPLGPPRPTSWSPR